MGFWVPRRIARCLLSALSLLSPSAVFTLLAGQQLHNRFPLLRWLWTGVRGEGGLPRLLANSSLNSRLGTQHGLAQSPPAAWRDSREPWPGLRSPAGVSSSFPCFSHRHCSDRCSLGWEGAGKKGFGVQSSLPPPAGGHRVLILGLASQGSSSLGVRGQPLGGPAEFGLSRGTQSPALGAWSRGGPGRLRVVQVEGGKSETKTWAVENKEVRRRELVTTPFPR